jgi:hypothetical protein
MDLPLIRRATLRAHLRAAVLASRPARVTDGSVDLARQKLLDAIAQIPSAGLAKVGDLRRYLRAADRARPLLSEATRLSVENLTRAWPMTILDDTLLKTLPDLSPAAEPVLFGNPRWLRFTRRKFFDDSAWVWSDPVNDTVTGNMRVTYDFGQVDFMVDSQDAFETSYTQDPTRPKRPGAIVMYWATQFSEPLTWVEQGSYEISAATAWSTGLIEVPGPTSLARRIRFVWVPD